MNNIIDIIKERAKKDIKKIVLPESGDKRVIEAASIAQKEGFAHPILIGDEREVSHIAEANNIDISKVEIINPNSFSDIDKLINSFYEIRKNKGISIEEATRIITINSIYFGNMLVKLGYADGLVSGSISTSSDTLRPALQIIKANKKSSIASSFFLMELDDKRLGSNGCFIYTDCGMIQNPTSDELVKIASSAASTFKLFLEGEPNIAFLSHSTYGSSICPEQEKVKKAVLMAKSEYPSLNIDGEMQFDTAIIKEIADRKAPGSKVAGKANVLIFPNLDSGNIAYKITERLAKAKAYGPLTQGLNKPINDLSRGCSVLDIVGVIAITALQAIDSENE